MKINFTKENKTELEKLYLELSFAGLVLPGKFNANGLNSYELLNNTTIESLRNIRSALKREIDAMSNNTDEWAITETEKNKLDSKKKWEHYLYLLIGYKLSLREANAAREELNNLKKQYKDMQEKAKTPEEIMKEVAEKIANLEKDISE